MAEAQQSPHQNGQALLKAMDTTLAHKVAVCAAHMMLKDGSTVLDAGCANGMTTAYFAAQYPNIHFIGIDYDQDYIEKAKAQFGHLPNIEFIKADLRDFTLDGRKIDVALNLSILHEPYSYDGYRAQTVLDILASELEHTQIYGLIPNRDFMLPDNPDEMIYIALADDGANQGDDYKALSMAEFFLRYSQEAMRFDNGNPDTHIKGFFTEEHTERLKNNLQGIADENSRVFSVQHQFAWEFIWRMHYRERFMNEAEEKYAFWTHDQHRKQPETLGARVLYSGPYENPWLLENRYEPFAKLFDKNLCPLPMPPSNFISVLQKINPGDSTLLREHRRVEAKPSYLQIKCFRNTTNGDLCDLVERPGGDVVDVLPYAVDGDDLIVFAKDQYPRPIANIKPRMMSPSLDGKRWSGHMTEPLAAANTNGDTKEAILAVLTERAGFNRASIKLDEMGSIYYYPAPSELNERVHAVRVQITTPPSEAKQLSGGHSGFMNDGILRPFNAQSLLQAAQVGMLPGARLETGIYTLMRERGISPQKWLGQVIKLHETSDIIPRNLDALLQEEKSRAVFEPSEQKSGWLDINRSEFHEITMRDGRENVIAKKELEFIVPSNDVSTNSVMLAPLVRDKKSGEVLIGVQKFSDISAQFASVQNREGHSGLLTLKGYRLPSTVEHIQNVPQWIADETGVAKNAIKKLGEGFFPSLGVMPNRIFPYVTTKPSAALIEQCDFVPLRELFSRLADLKDLHLINTVLRATHALDQWEEYNGVAIV